MPSVRPLPWREVEWKLHAAGFVKVGQQGSHIKFVRETPHGRRVTIVPQHREVGVGLLRAIMRKAGLTREAFERL
ncbi:MAG: type II toxin-antitoxin system HicA family toxin [Acidimicrobiaceae bacterium]|nr:type II toxin-antitoxin system HicA family toxin [Acidimicrobiaceae bacterium]